LLNQAENPAVERFRDEGFIQRPLYIQGGGAIKNFKDLFIRLKILL